MGRPPDRAVSERRARAAYLKARGWTLQAISDELGVSFSTVRMDLLAHAASEREPEPLGPPVTLVGLLAELTRTERLMLAARIIEGGGELRVVDAAQARGAQ